MTTTKLSASLQNYEKHILLQEVWLWQSPSIRSRQKAYLPLKKSSANIDIATRYCTVSRKMFLSYPYRRAGTTIKLQRGSRSRKNPPSSLQRMPSDITIIEIGSLLVLNQFFGSVDQVRTWKTLRSLPCANVPEWTTRTGTLWGNVVVYVTKPQSYQT